MGIHVDVSHLSQDECSQIVGVIAKDIALRKFDQERIRLVLGNVSVCCLIEGSFRASQMNSLVRRNSIIKGAFASSIPCLRHLLLAAIVVDHENSDKKETV